jgi:hypothetical protein
LFVRVIPIIIAALLLAAHFLRAGNLLLTAVCGLMPLLLLIKKRWSVWALQLFAFAGVVIWLGVAITIVRQRIMLGDSWLRVLFILGGVALFTAAAGLLLNSAAVKERYPPHT